MSKTLMNTLLATLDHLKSQHKKRVADYTAFFKSKQGAFKGIKKTHSPKDGFLPDPAYLANVGVVTTVDEKLEWFNQAFKELLKAQLSVDATNSVGAKTIELIVDGVSFGSLTATELMRLRSGILAEKSLDGVYTNIPVREDSVNWIPTTNPEYQGRQIYETERLSGSTRTTEKEEVILKDPNIDPAHLPSNYRAQTTVKTKQVITGDYTVQNFSGEWTHRQRAELLRRKSALLGAVEAALKDINASEAIPTNLDVEKFVNYLTYGKK